MISSLEAVMRANIKAYGYCNVNLTGRCMEPLLKAGDRARIGYPEDIQLGDIVLTIPNNGTMLLHRVVKIEQATVTTKGDLSREVESIRKERVLGKAISYSIGGRTWIEAVRSEEEIAKILELSLCIKTADWGRIDEYRRRIWKLNQAARRSMLNGTR